MMSKNTRFFLAVLWFGLAGAGVAWADSQITPAHPSRPVKANTVSPALNAIFSRSPEFDFDPPPPGSYRLSLIRPAPDGEVVLSDGAEGCLKDRMAGRIVLLSFIYTRCADARGCPLATALLYDIFEASAFDPAIAGNLKMISFSFDPHRDDAKTMRDYGYAALNSTSAHKKAPWDFLTTRSEQVLSPMLRGFGQTLSPSLLGKGKSSANFDHLLRVYLVDRQGWVRNIYGLGFLDPRLAINDVRTLLAEEAATAAGRP
jgi:protein SCO1/2